MTISQKVKTFKAFLPYVHVPITHLANIGVGVYDGYMGANGYLDSSFYEHSAVAAIVSSVMLPIQVEFRGSLKWGGKPKLKNLAFLGTLGALVGGALVPLEYTMGKGIGYTAAKGEELVQTMMQYL
jgi:hypothetical protein